MFGSLTKDKREQGKFYFVIINTKIHKNQGEMTCPMVVLIILLLGVANLVNPSAEHRDR